MKNERVIRYEPVREDESLDSLTLEYRRRQRANPPPIQVRAPARAPADTRSIFGRRESAAVQKHNARLDATEWDLDETEFVIGANLLLEYQALAEGVATVAASADEVRQLPPGSFEGAVGQQMLMDQQERIRNTNNDILEGWRRRRLGQ